MGIYEEEMIRNKNKAKELYKRVIKFAFFTPLITLIVLFMIVNIIDYNKLKHAQEKFEEGKYEEILHDFKGPFDFLTIDFAKKKEMKTFSTNNYLPQLIGKIDALEAENKLVELYDLIEKEETYLYPRSALKDKVSALLEKYFGEELNQALQSNDIKIIKQAFDKVEDTLSCVSQKVYLENKFMERIVYLLNQGDGFHALALLDEFKDAFDKESNERIDSFIETKIQPLNNSGLWLKDDIVINNQEMKCEFFKNEGFYEQLTSTNLYFAYYSNQKEGALTYVNVSENGNNIYENNVNEKNGIQIVTLNIASQNSYVDVYINENGAYVFYIYAYQPVATYAQWQQSQVVENDGE